MSGGTRQETIEKHNDQTFFMKLIVVNFDGNGLHTSLTLLCISFGLSQTFILNSKSVSVLRSLPHHRPPPPTTLQALPPPLLLQHGGGPRWSRRRVELQREQKKKNKRQQHRLSVFFETSSRGDATCAHPPTSPPRTLRAAFASLCA